MLPDHAGQLVARGVGRRAHDSSGRISTTGQPGQLWTMRSASSRSGTSISAYPLTTSLPSTNGPSVMTGSPRSSRTVVAVSGAFSLLPPRNLSAWSANHSLTRSYARSRSDGLIAAMSLVNCSVSTDNSTYFIAHTLCISVGIFRPHNEDDRRQSRYDTGWHLNSIRFQPIDTYWRTTRRPRS